MSFDVGAIVGKLTLDAGGWDSAIKKAQTDAKGFEKTLIQNGETLKKFGIGLAAVGALITATSIKFTTMAAKVQVTETIFSNSFGTMTGEARAWADELSRAYNLNSSGLLQSLANVNNMAKGLDVSSKNAFEMSKNLTMLSVEMSRFFGITQEDALSRLQMSLAGMTRPLRELGIIIKEDTVQQFALTHGIIRQGEALTETQAAMVRYTILLDKTRFLHGTLGESSKNLNSLWSAWHARLEDVGESIGARLVPAATRILEIIIKMTNVLLDLIERFPNITTAIVAFTASMGVLLTVAGAVMIALPGLATAATVMGTTIGGVALTLTASFLGWAAAVTAVVVALRNITTLKAVFENFSANVNSFLADISFNLVKFIDSLEKLPGITNDTFREMRDGMLRNAVNFRENAEFMRQQATESFMKAEEESATHKDTVIAHHQEISNSAEDMWKVVAKTPYQKMIQETQDWVRQTRQSFNVLLEVTKQTFQLFHDTIADTLMGLATGEITSFQQFFQNFGRNILKMIFDIIAQIIAMKIVMGIFGAMFGVPAVAGVGGYGASTPAGVTNMGNFSKLPSFDVGTDYVPHDMVAKVHKGERIIPADENKTGNIMLTLYNLITPQEVARAMSGREGKGVIVNTFDTNYGRGGIVRRTIKKG